MSTLIASTSPDAARALSAVLPAGAVTVDFPTSFEEAATRLSTASVVVSYASPTSFDGDEPARIRAALQHHAGWLRAAEALPRDRRDQVTVVTVTDGAGAGRAVAGAVVQLAASIGSDFDSPAHHYAITTEHHDEALAVSADLVACLVASDTDHALTGVELHASADAVALRTGPEIGETLVLAQGWTEQWLTRAFAQLV